MQSAKKITLIPRKDDFIQVGGGDENTKNQGNLTSEIEKTDKIKNKIYDKIHRFIKVILKLARNVAYDSELRIKLKNGKFLEKSNIVDLLTHAMSVGKVLYGENEFIELLARSDVDPNLIINENVRNKLIKLLKKPNYKINQEPDVIENVQNLNEYEQSIINKINQKRLDEGKRLNERKRPLENESDAEIDEMEAQATRAKKRKLSEDISDEEIDSEMWEIPNEVTNKIQSEKREEQIKPIILRKKNSENFNNEETKSDLWEIPKDE